MMNIPFTKYNTLGLLISSIILLVSITSIFFKGLNYGIDFKGGTLIELRSIDPKIKVSSLRDN